MCRYWYERVLEEAQDFWRFSIQSIAVQDNYKDKPDTRKNMERRTKSRNRECTVDSVWSRLGPVLVAYDMTSPLCSCWFVLGVIVCELFGISL